MINTHGYSFFLVLCFFCLFCCAYESPAEIVLPLLDPYDSISLPSTVSSRDVISIIFHTASVLSVDMFNNRTCHFPDILPNTKIKLEVLADEIQPAKTVQNVIYAAEQGHSLVFGVPESDSALSSSTTAAVYDMAVFSTFATTTRLSNELLYPTFSRIATSTIEQLITIRAVLLRFESERGRGWTDVAIIATINEYNLDYASSFIELSGTEITIQSYQQILSDQEDLSIELMEVKQSGARVIFGLVEGDYSEFIAKADEFGLVGEDFVWFTTAEIVVTPRVPDPLMRGTLSAVNYFPSSSQYQECFFEAWRTADPELYPYAGLGSDPTTLTYLPFDSVLTIAQALDVLDKRELLGERISPKDWNEAIRSVSFEGLSGDVSFYSNGDRIGAQSLRYYDVEANDFLTAMIREDELIPVQDITWFSNTTEIPDLDIREPFDYWSCEDKEMRTDETGKQVQLHSPDRSSADLIDSHYHCDQFIDCNNLSDESTDCSSNYIILFIVFGIITGILILIALILIVFVIVYGILWEYRRLRSASPFFLILLLLSIIVGFCSVFSFFGKPHPVACGFQPWLLGLSSISMIAALSVKNIRVYRIFKYPMTKMKITNFELFTLWSILMIPAVLILLVWSIVSTPTAKLEEINGEEHYVCTTGGFTGEPGGLVFFFIFVSYSALVLVLGVIVSFLVRNVPSMFNETKLLTFSIYNLLFLSVVIIPVLMVVEPINPFIAWILRTCAVLYAFTATMALQFIPKFFGIFIKDKGRNVRKFKSKISTTKESVNSI